MSKYKHPQYNLRIPAETKKQVAVLAEESMRSLNSWINMAIKEKLERDRKCSA